MSITKISAFLVSLCLLGASAQADIIEVAVWKAIASKPNSNPGMVQSALKSKSIQEKHGTPIVVSTDLVGRMYYATIHTDYAAWNNFYKAVGEDPKQAEFWKDANADPQAERIDHYLLETVSAGEGGAVREVYIWEALPGQLSRLIQGGLGAKPIHEKAGARVTVAVDRLNRMFYVMQYDSWDAYSKFHGAPIPEFSAYMDEQNKNPSGVLVEQFTASNVD
ncbi:MAG: hypothetical protein GKR90_19850 [Pseudomonadales bacterium]|nr:hypothetical protein [Pseudomonadales bacterium]